MRPGKIAGAGLQVLTFTPPPNWKQEIDGICDSLVVRVWPPESRQASPILESAWFPTAEELQHLNNGHPVRLSIWAGGQPPVALTVDGNTPAERPEEPAQ